MKKIFVPIIDSAITDIEMVRDRLQNAPSHTINNRVGRFNTSAQNIRASFSILRNKTYLMILFRVSEPLCRAMIGQCNGCVYTDSCVEFFVQQPKTKIYYNFEFNCIGTVLGEFGAQRKNRQKIDPQKLQTILRLPSLGYEPFSYKNMESPWTLTVMIPFCLCIPEEIDTSKSSSLCANFYKCGDLLPNPHYLSWNEVSTTKPDFHKPEFFGTLHCDPL